MKLKAGGQMDLLDVRELLKLKNLDHEFMDKLARKLRIDKKLAGLGRLNKAPHEVR